MDAAATPTGASPSSTAAVAAPRGRDAPATRTDAARQAEAGLDEIARLLSAGGAAVLTGAGLSTESGIPDYRGETGRRRRGSPMTYQEFTAAEENRRRYWARSFLGWPAITAARPNAGHRAVARLAAAGLVTGVVTQNVDGLHLAAGTSDAVELHGSLHHVLCLDCGTSSPRTRLQHRLRAANPDFAEVAAHVNADGDAELPEAAVAGFRTAACEACGTGTLKPDVVFFGETVPPQRVARCYELVDAAPALLVLGSSLTVMSGLRFVRHAARRGKPVAVVNQGATRGDGLASALVNLPLGAALTELAARSGA
ncbi:NAD-dependent protein deacetylase [Actinacidiphila yeochonensis]|uniref:NAD-dependent protein deacetylase n=1 Tax=Actinacidiphila yeochonensis TaxID=89050 RepID=UPI00099C29BC|nr:NAD-dependent protein deacetylase [Actinacidiphila yeochonensis]